MRSKHAPWAPYFFTAPFVLIFLVFLAYPLVQSVIMAFRQYNGPAVSQYVGLDNFRWMVQDEDFWTAAKNTLIFAAASLFIQQPAALGLAMLLNRKDVKARAFWRMIFFAPSLVGLVFMAILAALMFSRNGLVNEMLSSIPLLNWDQEFPWLERFVMPALIISAFWMYVGFNMVYYLAALQNVSQDLMEAAHVDGANPWQRFVNVTLPSIWPVATFVVLLSMIGSFQLFELPYLLLNNSGGPDNQGLTVVMYLYQKGFDAGRLGYASTVGWALAVFLLGLGLIQRWIGQARDGS